MPSTILTGAELAAALGSTALAGNAATATKLAAGGWFVSTTQTGTGAPQNIAHGLGVTPSAWWHCLLTTSGDPGMVRGSADATNVVMTAAVGVTYIVVAVK